MIDKMENSEELFCAGSIKKEKEEREKLKYFLVRAYIPESGFSTVYVFPAKETEQAIKMMKTWMAVGENKMEKEADLDKREKYLDENKDILKKAGCKFECKEITRGQYVGIKNSMDRELEKAEK